MEKFRKKPVVIEAVQFNGENIWDVLNWVGAESAYVDPERVLRIRTLESGEGSHIASEGDWIIKGIAGEFYPCKPDIFAATYEPVPDAGAEE